MVVYIRRDQWEFLRDQERMSMTGRRRRKVSQSQLVRAAIDLLMKAAAR